MAKNTLKLPTQPKAAAPPLPGENADNVLVNPVVEYNAAEGSPIDEVALRNAVMRLSRNTIPVTEELRIACDLALKALKSPCIYKAPLDEPLFVLRAQDNTAALFVRRWLRWAVNTIPNFPQEKVDMANDVAMAMDAWSKNKNPD